MPDLTTRHKTSRQVLPTVEQGSHVGLVASPRNCHGQGWHMPDVGTRPAAITLVASSGNCHGCASRRHKKTPSTEVDGVRQSSWLRLFEASRCIIHRGCEIGETARAARTPMHNDVIVRLFMDGVVYRNMGILRIALYTERRFDVRHVC